MATYLNEIKNETLYKRKFFLPINEEDKRHNSLIFLLSDNLMGSYELRNNPFALNLNKSFMSYYMEPNVKYYMNIKENTLTSEFDSLDLIDEYAEVSGENLINEATNDKNYGLPDLKKYPMPDAKHVKSAIKFFNYVDAEHEEQLANAIKRNIKKFGIDHVNVGKKNRFSKYVKNMKQVTINESIDIPASLKQFKACIIEDLEDKQDQDVLIHYRDRYPRLNNIIFSDAIKGIIFVDDDDDIVGYVFVDIKTGCIKAFEVSSSYRNQGYEYLLVDIARNQYGAKSCTVPTSAELTRRVFHELEWNESIKDGYAVYTINESVDTITESFDYRIENLTIDLANKYLITIPDFVDTVSGKVLLRQDNDNYFAAASYVVDDDTIVSMSYISVAAILDLLKHTLKDSNVKYAIIDDKYTGILKIAGFEDYDDTLLKYKGKPPVSKMDDEYIQRMELDGQMFTYSNPISEDSFILTNEEIDNIIDEASSYSTKLKNMLYKDRIRSNKEALKIYASVKEIDKNIQRTFLSIDRYRGLNLFVDLYYYNNLFLKNLKLASTTPIKSNDMYFKFLLGLLKDKRYDANYFVKTIFIPVKESEYKNRVKKDTYLWDYRQNVNTISCIAKVIRERDSSLITKLDGYTFVFIGNNGYFKTDKISDMKYPMFISLIKRLYNKELIGDTEENKDSPKAIKTYIVNSIETSKNLEINNLVGKSNTKKDKVERMKSSEVTVSSNDKENKAEEDKKEIVEIIDQYANKSTNVQDTLKKIDSVVGDAEAFKSILKDLEKNSSNRVKIDATRAARMDDLNNKFLRNTVQDKSIEELINDAQVNTPLPETNLNIDTINEEWKHLHGTNFEKTYDIDEDIISIIYSLKDKSYPISILDINKEDTSNSEDHVYTYTVYCEDSFGSRFTLKFDIPKFRNNRFMRLKGNEKTLNGQLLLLPIIKTDEDTVQIVTSYKKIFIRRYGESTGKSIPQADAIMKALDKYTGNAIKVVKGDNSRICSKYELPIDYIDLARVYTRITVNNANKDKYEFYFNQDELREKYKIDDTKGIPYGVMNDKDVLYYDGQGVLSSIIQAALSVSGDEEIRTLMEQATRRKKYTYSRASILNSQIPLIVVMAYSEGLTSSLSKAKIEYELSERRPKLSNDYDLIRFKDGYLKYRIEYDSSLLLNGLKDCDTENYSIKDINDKEMWVDFLDAFGGRIKADGLDNFYDLTMDPITVDICKIYGLPTDYIEVLAYANLLLSDNKYNKHVDITGNRYRTNEQIAALFYESLCESYEQYKLQIKNGRNKPTMSMKQSSVIDKLMAQPTFSDLSVFSPLLEYEAASAVSFKGKSGMNSDRSYGLDKRIYDKSMVNVLALSTGFAANVGLTRQTTIDKNIVGKRGLIKESDPKDMDTTKALCMTEALTPFGSTHDDPFRSAMTFVQSSKHGMRTKKQSPLLITNGADEALPYLCSDMFAFKAKAKGKVIEITKDYMIIQYADNRKDFIDLRENIKKNSDGGVFEVLKLDTDLKVGDMVKEGQIVAYDKKSFVNNTGSHNLSASVGVLSKIAILETDEGYEDSSIISNRLSENLMSQVVIQKEVLLDANTNVYKMIKKGASVNVGDTLMVIQNAFDDEDANILLKNITDEEYVTTVGRIPITSKITGVVQDIKIYRSCDLEDMSDSLRKIVRDYESNIKKLKDASKDSIDNAAADLEPDYKLPPTGKLKNSPNHVLIEFYLRYDDKMSIGEK